MKDAFSDLELKAYSLLLEKNTQKVVAKILGIDKAQLSRFVKKFVSEQYLIEERIGNTKFYKKGMNGKLLDKLFVARQLTVDDRGVTSVDKNIPEKPCLVHHLKYRFNVLDEGDLEKLVEKTDDGRLLERPFLRKYQDYHGAVRYTGQTPYYDKWVTVQYERTAKQGTIYIFPPDIECSKDDLRNKAWDEIAKTVCLDISCFMQKHGKWRLGLPELCPGWKRHIAIDHETMRGYAENLFVRTSDGKGWLSDSEGRDEAEYSDEEHVLTFLELPNEVIKIKGNLKEIVETLNLVLEAQEKSTIILGKEVGTRAKSAVESVQRASATAANGSPSESESTFSRDKYEVMYR